jgi:hypothetical protein
MKKLLVIHFLFFSIGFFAQAPLRFYTKFGGNGIDIGYSGKPTLDKQYIVTGSTSSYGAGNTDVYLVKVDSMGFPIWEMIYGGFNNDVGKSVIQLPDSGFVVAGFTNSFGAGGYDAYILRTDKKGTLIWQKTFGGLDWDFANDLVLASDGGIVVCGNTSSFGAGKKDGLMLKYDLAGNLIWQKIIGGIENEELRSVIKTNDNLLASVGLTQSKGDVNGDCYFVKFDLNGDTLFTKYFGGPGKDHANDIVQKNSSEFVICGAKTYSASPNTESLMYGLSASGTFLWENHYTDSPGLDEEFFSNCEVGYHPSFTSYTRNRPKSPFKMQTSIFVGLPLGIYYKITEEGGIEDEFCYSIESTPDGGYVTVGVTYSFGSLNGDVYFLKQDTTLINNLSVVGLKENHEKSIKPLLKFINYNEVEINVENNSTIQYFKLVSVDGIILNENIIDASKLSINLDAYPKTLLILHVKLKNGSTYLYKIPNG